MQKNWKQILIHILNSKAPQKIVNLVTHCTKTHFYTCTWSNFQEFPNGVYYLWGWSKLFLVLLFTAMTWQLGNEVKCLVELMTSPTYLLVYPFADLYKLREGFVHLAESSVSLELPAPSAKGWEGKTRGA